jgi:predicted DNA-binding transcriptional regulator YafY
MLGLIRQKGSVTRREFIEQIEVSPATFKRDLEYLRSRLNVPIDWDRERNGYRIDPEALAKGLAELPGLWFSAEEAHALLTMYQLLSRLEPGLLESQVAPLRERLEKLIATRDARSGATARLGARSSDVLKRVRVIAMGGRGVPARYFSVMARALLERRQLRIHYYNRERDQATERDVSPQRLTHYRDNWYLDAWCHLRKGLRSFAVDAVKDAHILEARAREVPDQDLDRELASSYGIFGGAPTATAQLRFSAARARWVSRESWHPDQKSSWDGQGRFLLEIPYHDDRELLMDILRHGPDVEVLTPESLRRRHREQLEQALQQYK